MKFATKLSFLILIGCTMISLSSCNTPAQKEGGETTTNKASVETPAATEMTVDSTKADTSASEESPAPVMNTAEWASLEGLTVNCGGSAMNLALPLNVVAASLEAQNLMYDTKPFTDCSGIFHRVLDSINRRCPDLDFPSPKTHRSSRGVGKWYHEKGTLVQVRDPLAAEKLIVPGAVMFYAGRSVNPDSIEVDALFKQGGIRHVGVVVDTKVDEATGELKSYTLFHGRTTGKVAKKTSYHDRKPSRSSYPPYGNGGDHLVAIAPIASN